MAASFPDYFEAGASYAQAGELRDFSLLEKASRKARLSIHSFHLTSKHEEAEKSNAYALYKLDGTLESGDTH